jgi:mercuric ion transport protein
MNEHAGDILSSTPARASATAVERSHESGRRGLLAAGGIVGAVASASCCIVPLVLFSLGATGAWIGQLSAMYPYKWYFFAATAAFLAGGFYMVYRRQPVDECKAGTSCATPVGDRIYKAALWGATALVLAATAFPYVAPAFLES